MMLTPHVLDTTSVARSSATVIKAPAVVDA
jgi:hypothetical protein